MIPYNSILNDSWYNRLRRRITEQATSGIRATRSEADDPYWRAREAEGHGDLAAARRDAELRLYEGGLARRAGIEADYKAREARRYAGAWQPEENLTILGGSYGAPEVPAPGTSAPLPGEPAGTPAPLSNTSYLQGASAPPHELRGATMNKVGTVYPASNYTLNAGRYRDPMYERWRKRLLDINSRLAKQPVY